MADIELMIKIDEEQYKFIKQSMTMDKVKDYHALLYAICEHIAKGTPLSKGHGGLIDIKDLYEHLNKERDDNFVLKVDAIVDKIKPIIKADNEVEE